jgi:hypothetical protein
MRLNDTVTRHAKPGPKRFKLFDGGGLYLLVNASGRRRENQPIPPLAHAFQRFTIGSTSIVDRSTFRGTEHAASPLIHG